MADGKKIYQIVINGISESVDAVKSLNEQLNILEEKINSLQNKTVNITTNQINSVESPTTNTGDRTSTLKEEDAVLKQIEQTEEKIAQMRSDGYQELLHQKDILKDVKKESAARFAEDNLSLKEYDNTMQGIKDRLADLKKAMQIQDIDSDAFKKMAAEAKELTDKLKEAEKSYGVFSRDVGNYSNGVVQGLKTFSVEVGGIKEEFDSARQALKALKTEMQTLSTKKDMGIITEEEADRLKGLIPVVKELESSIADAGKPMDALMDTFQSLVAVMQTTKGISAFFGIDSEEIDKTIKNLVALQNAMQGLQTIQKQIQTGEGIGRWIKPFAVEVDNATAKMLKFNTALLGTGKASKAAAVAIKGFGKALKAAFSVGILLVVDLLIDGLMNLVDTFKKVDKEAERTKEIEAEVSKAYASGTATIAKYTSIAKNFNGTKEQEKKLVKQLNSELGNSLGTYNSLAKWLDVLINKGAKYVEMLMLQAKAQASFNNYVKALEAQQQVENSSNEDYEQFWQKFLPSSWTEEMRNRARVSATQSATAYTESMKEEMLNSQKELDSFMKKNSFGDYSPQIKEGGKKSKDEAKKQLEQIAKTINDLQMRLMDDGLNKRLRQLDEEKRQTLNKLKQNSTAYLAVEQMYEKLRLKEIKNFLKDIEKSIQESADRIKNESLTLNISKIEEDIKKLDRLFEERRYEDSPIVKTLVSSTDYAKILKLFDTTNEKVEEARRKYEELNDDYNTFILSQATNEGIPIEKSVFFETLDEYQNRFDEFTKEYEVELNFIRNYTLTEEKTLKESFEKRYNDEKEYFLKERKLEIDSYGENFEKLQIYLWDRTKLLKKQADDEKQIAENAASGAYETQKESLEKQSQTLKDGMLAITNQYGGDLSKMSDEDKKAYDKMQADLLDVLEQLGDAWNNYTVKVENIKKQHENRLAEIDKEEKEKMSAETEKYFNAQISNFRDFNSKMSDELSKTPTYDKYGFGIVNLSATKKQYKEIKDAALSTIRNILTEKSRLDSMFEGGFIDKEAYAAMLSQLNDVEKSATDALNAVGEKIKDIPKDFMEGVNVWIQQIGQAMGSILGSISEIQSNQYDKMIEEQEKYIDKYSDLLDKQKDKTEEYADAIKNIEDELSTARGDRRQQLIDMLNAEMAAQRASLAQEKKIEKEKEKAEEKKKKLEHDQAVAKKKMDLAQAYINAAMAVSMAAVNNWPIPAVPMMALAAAVGAAQIAAIKSQNIPSYGEGGVIQGKSHRQGGVQALVGGKYPVELEGNEFIIRKASTSSNVDVLDFINRSERKLKLEDFIDFYANDRIKKHFISTTPKARYAEGGTVIPTLRNDIEVNNRVLQAIEDYSQRPQYVEVVEIMDKIDSVNNVQVLAGLKA